MLSLKKICCSSKNRKKRIEKAAYEYFWYWAFFNYLSLNFIYWFNHWLSSVRPYCLASPLRIYRTLFHCSCVMFTTMSAASTITFAWVKEFIPYRCYSQIGVLLRSPSRGRPLHRRQKWSWKLVWGWGWPTWWQSSRKSIFWCFVWRKWWRWRGWDRRPRRWGWRWGRGGWHWVQIVQFIR